LNEDNFLNSDTHILSSTMALGGLCIVVVRCKTWKLQLAKGCAYWNGHIFSGTGMSIFMENITAAASLHFP